MVMALVELEESNRAYEHKITKCCNGVEGELAINELEGSRVALQTDSTDVTRVSLRSMIYLLAFGLTVL